MSRQNLSAAFSVVLTALMLPSLHAQDQAYDGRMPGVNQIPTHAYEPSGYGTLPFSQAGYRAQDPAMGGFIPPVPIDPNPAPPGMPEAVPGYVRLGAPLYPCPKPNIPIWTGSTLITNQAMAPHEMLYPHTYRAIYPPFYHRVKGGWILTPFGVRSRERWELQGTQVQVKYRSHYPGLFSGHCWHPPATSYRHGAWK